MARRVNNERAATLRGPYRDTSLVDDILADRAADIAEIARLTAALDAAMHSIATDFPTPTSQIAIDLDPFTNALSIDLADAARFIKQLHADAAVTATEIARLTRERDETRAKLATLEADRRVHAVDVARRQRDVARSKIERVRLLYTWRIGMPAPMNIGEAIAQKIERILADEPEPTKEE